MKAASRLLILAGSALLVAACGSATASGGTVATPTAAPGAGRGSTFGQIVQVSGNSLTVSTAAGDVSVDYTSATAITSTSTGTPGDIVTGTCVTIAGLKDSTGAVTATSVRLSHPVNGACAASPFGGGRPPRNFSPRPTAAGGTPRPTLNPNAVVVSGMVTSAVGTTVTVTAPGTGTVTSVTVPTTLSVVESSAGTAADLTVDSCVRAIGQKNPQGVVQATLLTLSPANATGACTAAGGGFGFGGGRGFGGGGGVPTAG